MIGAAEVFNMAEVAQSIDALGLVGVDVVGAHELDVAVIASLVSELPGEAASAQDGVGAGDALPGAAAFAPCAVQHGHVQVTITRARQGMAPLPQRSARRTCSLHEQGSG